MLYRIKRVIVNAVDTFARVQRKLCGRSPRYRRLMSRIARLGSYAITGLDSAKQIGRLPSLGADLGAHKHTKSAGAIMPIDASDKELRIQLYRQGALGDVLLVTAILRAVREKHRDAVISVVTAYPDLLKGNPYVNEVMQSAQPLGGFDVTFDLQYELTPDEHIVAAYARIADVQVSDYTPEIYLTLQERLDARNLLLRHGIDFDKPVCAFHMHSGWEVRDWPQRYFQEVANVLERAGIQVLLLGKSVGVQMAYGTDLRGKTTVRELAAVIEKCSALLAVDSSIMHMGIAQRVPTVSLFGCTDPEKRLPRWALANAYYGDVVCKGCHHRQRPLPAIFAPRCPWESVRCMESISPDDVANRIVGLLNREPAVSIVIPHFNHFSVLDHCLASIFRSGAESVFEVIVVDDCSTDRSIELVQGWIPRVRLVRQIRNSGFSASCNAGADSARAARIVFLNNDTAVCPGWLDELMKAMDAHPNVGTVGPKLLYPEGRYIQHCGTAFNELGVAEHIYRYLPASFIPANRPRLFRALTGACLMVRRSEFLEIGGFDEMFRMGGEDTDLCFRYLSLGKPSLYWPPSEVYHYEGLTRGLRDQNDADDIFNRDLLKQRWPKFLAPDISDYCLLAEVEAAEGRHWLTLNDVPPQIVEKYDSPDSRRIGRFPFYCEIGSGMHPQPGYIHLDVIEDTPSVDLVYDIENPLPFLDNTVKEILANHVVEHVSWRRLPLLLKELYRVLEPGGTLFIRTPNLRFISESYLTGDISKEHPNDEAAVKELYGALTPGLWANIKLFSGQDYKSNFHFLCMDPTDLKRLLQLVGFQSISFDHFGREFSPGEIQASAVK